MPTTDLMTAISMKAVDFTLDFGQETAGQGSGATRSLDLRPAFWRARFLTAPATHGQALGIQALIESLVGSIGSFLVWDPRARYPQADPTGSILGASSVIVHSSPGGRQLALSGLPAAYVLTRGDMLSITHANGIALHRVSETVTADAFGITPIFQVEPFVLDDIVQGLAVDLTDPSAEMVLVPGSFSPAMPGPFQTTFSFEAVQSIYSADPDSIGVAGGPTWVLDGFSLDLDFAGGRGWFRGGVVDPADAITCTRSTVAYADSAATGVWSSFAVDVPRITDKGLLREEGRTNSIRNSAAGGVASGTPGTLPTNWFKDSTATQVFSIVGFGTDNGVDYIDFRINTGVSNNDRVYFGIGFEPSNGTGIASGVSAGQVWAGSFFAKIVAGSIGGGNCAAVIRPFNSGGTGLTDQSAAITLASSGAFGQARKSVIGTLPANSARLTSFLLVQGLSTGAPLDVTIRIGWPQLELGAYVTSPIRTTSATVTRGFDTITVKSFSKWFVGTYGTLYADATLAGATSGEFPGVVGFRSGGSGLTGFFFNGSTGNGNGIVRDDASVTQASLQIVSAAAATAHKLAMAWRANDVAAVADGGTVQADASVTLITTLSELNLGRNDNFSSGYLRRVAYAPQRRTNAQLQAITA